MGFLDHVFLLLLFQISLTLRVSIIFMLFMAFFMQFSAYYSFQGQDFFLSMIFFNLCIKLLVINYCCYELEDMGQEYK